MSKPVMSKIDQAQTSQTSKSAAKTTKDERSGEHGSAAQGVNIDLRNGSDGSSKKAEQSELPTEFGGQKGLEPTRYGDWEKNGRCTDF